MRFATACLVAMIGAIADAQEVRLASGKQYVAVAVGGRDGRPPSRSGSTARTGARTAIGRTRLCSKASYAESVRDNDAAAARSPSAAHVRMVRKMLNERTLQPEVVIEEHR